jgi:hypothetical protein
MKLTVLHNISEILAVIHIDRKSETRTVKKTAYSRKQNPSSESYSREASQEIRRLS